MKLYFPWVYFRKKKKIPQQLLFYQAKVTRKWGKKNDKNTNMVIEIVDILYTGNNSENKIDMYFAGKKR